MTFPRERLEELIYGGPMARRLTQDSPILPDVWFEYALRHEAIDLLITPYQRATGGQTTPGALSVELRRRLAEERKREPTPGFPKMADRGSPQIAYNQSTVLARLWFDELIRVVLPMSHWWAESVVRTGAIRELDDPDESLKIRRNENLIRALNDAGPVPMGTPSPFYLRIDREQKEAVQKLKDTLRDRNVTLSGDVLWMLRVVGTIAVAIRNCLVGRGATAANAPKPKGRGKRGAKGQPGTAEPDADLPPQAAPPQGGDESDFKKHRSRRHEFLANVINAAVDLIQGLHAEKDPAGHPMVHSVSLNRRASASVMRSRIAVKADAAMRVFDLRCDAITWAIVDSGIDATHPAFRLRKPDELVEKPSHDAQPDPRKTYLYRAAFEDGELKARVLETYDFTKIQLLMSLDELEDEQKLPEDLRRRLDAVRAGVAARKGSPADSEGEDEDPLAQLRRSLKKGRDVDWDLLIPFTRIYHNQNDDDKAGRPKYQAPVNEHGTHVAGILGGDWGDRVQGICPDIRLIDLRALDDQGQGDEFNVIAALQFIRFLRARRDYATVHGVNLSLSIRHDVANYACGRTPVCDECERLIGNGLVVVAAAGNDGYQQYMTPKGPLDAYRSISITDPGNAEGVITVGSTHRFQPHTYGVSYFSSRGPTGDGRCKPDLVAPGEKIEAPVPGDEDALRRMDGTSMAAPHVSGAAALLIARHRELSGNPEKIKQILCKTATDLGRERYFQGHGMVDILRALQSV
jgi:serine protease AprX